MSMLIEVKWSERESGATNRHFTAVLIAGSIEGACERVRKRCAVSEGVKLKGKIITNGIYYRTWIGDPD